MADSYGLATLQANELDIVTTAATTVYIPIVVAGIPKRITLANLLTVMNTNLTFLDLSDTPAEYSASDTLKVNAGADAVEFVTV